MISGEVGGVGAGARAPTFKTYARKAVRRVPCALKAAALFGKVARSSAEAIEFLRKVKFPRNVEIGLAATKFPSIILGLMSMQRAAEDIWNMVKEPRKSMPLKRFEAACKFITHLDSTTRSVANILKFLKTVGVVGVRAVSWIPVFDIVSCIVGFISLGLASVSIHKSRKLLNEFEKLTAAFEKAQTPELKALILERAVDLIESKGIEPLRKELGLSKAAKATLQERIDRVRQMKLPAEQKQVSDARAMADMHEAMVILRGRVKIQLGFKAADMALDIAGIAGAILSMIPVTAPAGIAVALTSAVCSVVTIGGRAFFINSNPFDPKSQSKAKQLLNKIARACEHIRHDIHVSLAAHGRFSRGRRAEAKAPTV